MGLSNRQLNRYLALIRFVLFRFNGTVPPRHQLVNAIYDWQREGKTHEI